MRKPFSPLLLVLPLAAAGCSPSGNPGAQSPERQADAEYDVARDLYYKGQLRSALEHARKAVEFDDDNAKALYFAGMLHLAFCTGVQGMKSSDCQLAEAEKYVRKSLQQDGTFRDARNGLGQVLILEGKYKDAIEVLKPLVNDPAYAAVHLAWGNLGWAQVQSGAVDEGIASLKNAVTQPKFCVGFYRLGIAYEKKGDLAQAESSLSEAVQVDSPDCQELQDAWYERGLVRLKLGKNADACADLARCREISADNDVGKQCVQLQVKSACSTAAPKSGGEEKT